MTAPGFHTALEYFVWGCIYVLAGFGIVTVGCLVCVAIRVCVSSARLVKEPSPPRYGETMAAEAKARRLQKGKAASQAPDNGQETPFASPRDGTEGFMEDVELGRGGGGMIGAEEEVDEERYEDAVAPSLELPRIVPAVVAPAQ